MKRCKISLEVVVRRSCPTRPYAVSFDPWTINVVSVRGKLHDVFMFTSQLFHAIFGEEHRSSSGNVEEHRRWIAMIKNDEQSETVENCTRCCPTAVTWSWTTKNISNWVVTTWVETVTFILLIPLQLHHTSSFKRRRSSNRRSWYGWPYRSKEFPMFTFTRASKRFGKTPI